MFDISTNRKARKWTPYELILRFCWELTSPIIFTLTPRPFWGWRRFVLRLFCATIGRHVHVQPSVKIALPWNLYVGDYASIGDSVRIYNLGTVKIGDRVTVSQNVHLCAGTHDYQSPDMPLIKASILIQSDAWVCADAFVGPWVIIGKSSVLGARSVAVRNVPDFMVAVGNPARSIKSR